MKLLHWTAASALAFVLLAGGQAFADADKKIKETHAFGTLKSTTSTEARDFAENWLKSTGKTDDATRAQFGTIWVDEERPTLDKIADTLVLGSPEAKKLLADANDPKASAPTDLPAVLKDTKVHPFLRANLALAYAKTLSNRRIYEEALDSLKAVKAEQVCDPGQYLFLKAVAEHALIMKKEAYESITRLLDDVPDAPDRYRMVGALMLIDMANWRDKDLDWVARKMDNIERRLDLARGGKKTQEMQRQVVARLDELIKEKENQQKCNCNGGNCPSGGQKDVEDRTVQPSSPKNDSVPGSGTGPGQVDPKKVRELAEQWGKLPERERNRMLVDLTRDMPPAFREGIESYFRKIQPELPK
jgi:tetratricopeptide (TPR) repeat protein